VSRRVKVVADFDAPGYTSDPREQVEHFLKQAQGYVATQRRSAGDSYRGQVWSFLMRLLESARVQRPLKGLCSACGAPLDARAGDGSWRWNGEFWEHKCPGSHPQAGHFRAVGCGARTAPRFKPPESDS
jgi:hypothetical protein